MTERRDVDLDFVLGQFLGDGPTEAPDPALAAALERVAKLRQRHDPFLGRPRMSTPIRLLVAAAVVIGLLAGGAVLVGNRTPTEQAPASPPASVAPLPSTSPPSPTLPPPTATPSASPSATPAASSSAESPSGSAAASPAMLLVKTYWCRTLAEAAPLIVADGFTVGETTRSDKVPGDIPATWRVLQQAPNPGEMGEPGLPIDLLFANHSNTETSCS